MNDPNAKMATPSVAVPVWQQAHETLNSIYQDMELRIKEIDAQMNRLHSERESIVNVISRISPSAPQPSGVASTGFAGSAGLPNRW